MRIHLTDKDREKAEEFADLRCTQSNKLYQKRGGFKREDIVIGAMAEIAVYKTLRKHNFKVGKPDFTLHEFKNKSYDSDLSDTKYHFHVKGQSMVSAKRYGKSWLFQRRDSLVKEPELYHYIVPCVVNLENNTVVISGFLSSTAIHGKIGFSECKVPSFRTYKVALYEENFKKVSDKTKWGILKKGGSRV